MEDRDDEGEHVKEVFAYFGRAFYLACVLEAGLANALLWLDFLTKVREEHSGSNRKGFDREKYESDFDKFLEDQYALTMGNLMRRVQASIELPEDLKALIGEAKERRNFLGHHFFRERSIEFATSVGRNKMLAELQDATDLFQAVDTALQAIVSPKVEAFGIKQEAFEAYYREYMDAIRSERSTP